MKTIFLILSLLCAFGAQAQSIITATLTATNTAGIVNGNTLVINGVTRTVTNTVTSAGTQILSATNITGSASNIFISLTSVRPPNADVFTSSTNAITIKSYIGSPMAVTIGGSWGTVSLSTNTITAATPIRAPISAAGNYERTNAENALVDYFNDGKNSNVVSASSTALSNHVNLSTAQTITGAKTFSGANSYSNPAQVFNGGTITNSILSNCIPALTNGYATNIKLTNGVNYGNPFRSPGTGNGSEQFGTGASALNDGALAVGNGATGNGIGATSLGASASSIDGATAVGASANAAGGNSTAIGNGSVAQGVGGIAIGQSAESDLEYGIAIGYFASASYTNSIAIGPHAGADQAFQVKLGTSIYSVSIPGNLQVSGSISNATFVGSVTLNNSLISPRKNISGLVNGPNSAVDTSTNYYIKISGPSAAYSISGFNGGVNGRSVIIQKNDSWVLTILNDSGTEPGLSATNRIYTGTGADVTVTNNPGFIRLLYDTATSHWGVESKSN